MVVLVQPRLSIIFISSKEGWCGESHTLPYPGYANANSDPNLYNSLQLNVDVTYIFQVIVGGVNLLEQAEEQERLLDKSAKELEKRKRKEKLLRSQLEQKEAEKLDIEERYANLQEEATGKTKRLKEVWKQFQQTKEEVDDC